MRKCHWLLVLLLVLAAERVCGTKKKEFTRGKPVKYILRFKFRRDQRRKIFDHEKRRFSEENLRLYSLGRHGFAIMGSRNGKAIDNSSTSVGEIRPGALHHRSNSKSALILVCRMIFFLHVFISFRDDSKNIKVNRKEERLK